MDIKQSMPPGKYVMEAPSQLCLYSEEHIESTLAFFKALETSPKKIGYFITIDFSNLTYISAAAACYMFSLITSVQVYVSNNYYTVKLPKDKDAKKLFVDSGFHVAIKKGGYSKIKKMWKTSPFLCGNNNQVPDILTVFRKHSEISTLPVKLTTALRETFLNINHHAYNGPSNKVGITWWCYHFIGSDKNGKYLVAIIVDRGMGIVNQIRNAFPEYRSIVRISFVKTDSECIEYAMQESITSTLEKGRGKGSEDIKKPVTLNNDDILYIMSNGGCYRYKTVNQKEDIKLIDLDNDFKGTLVEWKLYF